MQSEANETLVCIYDPGTETTGNNIHGLNHPAGASLIFVRFQLRTGASAGSRHPSMLRSMWLIRCLSRRWQTSRSTRTPARLGARLRRQPWSRRSPPFGRRDGSCLCWATLTMPCPQVRALVHYARARGVLRPGLRPAASLENMWQPVQAWPRDRRHCSWLPPWWQLLRSRRSMPAAQRIPCVAHHALSPPPPAR